MSLVLATAPAAPIMTTAEAKAHLRVSGSGEDGLIDTYVLAITKAIENYTGRRLISQVWDLWLNGIPLDHGQEAWWDGVREGRKSSIMKQSRNISLLVGPVSAVTHVKTYSDTDAESTMSSTNYFVDTQSSPGRLCLDYNATWPTNLRAHNAVNVRFTAGYGTTAASVPMDIITAAKLMLMPLYEGRGACAEGELFSSIVLTLLQPYRIMGFDKNVVQV